MKPYYEHAGITIYHGDCRDVLPLVRADVLISDPPWGVSVKTNNAARGRGHRPYDPNCRAVDLPPVHGDDRPFDPSHLLGFRKMVLWGANHYSDLLPKSACWLVWDRKTERGADSDITDCELAWTRGLSFKTVRIYRHMWAGFQRDSEVGQKVLHPTQKPVSLYAWCLSFFPVGSVIDPYMAVEPRSAPAWRVKYGKARNRLVTDIYVIGGAMNDPKPLRQEDYAAMSEELRRARAEVARLRDAPRRKAALLSLVRRVLLVGGASMLIVVVIGGGWIGLSALWSWANSPSPAQQKYPCYFTRHHASDYEERHHTLPWEQWKVFRDDPDSMTRHEEVTTAGAFKTQGEAWSFMQKWNLEVCR